MRRVIITKVEPRKRTYRDLKNPAMESAPPIAPNRTYGARVQWRVDDKSSQGLKDSRRYGAQQHQEIRANDWSMKSST